MTENINSRNEFTIESFSKFPKIYYVFMYCLYHDDGYLLKVDEKHYQANKLNYDNYLRCKNACCVQNSDACCYKMNGVLLDDGLPKLSFHSLVERNYDKYFGGYKLKFFKNNLMDEELNKLPIENEPKLANWFDVNT
jgi:hypothetical protein